MKLVSHIKEGHEQLAILVDDRLYDADEVHPELPSTMGMLLNYWEDYINLAKAINTAIIEGRISPEKGTPLESAVLLSPVTQPASLRDAHAFAGKSPFPTFDFGNHHSIQGPGEVRCMPDHLKRLDFELEWAVVICKPGRNIRAEEADEYIGGYLIMNNVSARHLQMEEAVFNAGAAKGKDFATAIGPYLVTPDELEAFILSAEGGHTGSRYSLPMKCFVNGTLVAEGSTASMNWTFAEIIERCSYGADLYPGDIIGSGAVGSGSFMDLNRIAKNDPEFSEQWLKEGDLVEMEIDGLGKLSNSMVAEEGSELEVV